MTFTILFAPANAFRARFSHTRHRRPSSYRCESEKLTPFGCIRFIIFGRVVRRVYNINPSGLVRHSYDPYTSSSIFIYFGVYHRVTSSEPITEFVQDRTMQRLRTQLFRVDVNTTTKKFNCRVAQAFVVFVSTGIRTVEEAVTMVIALPARMCT